MTVLLIVLGSLAAYIVAGLFYGRSQIRQCYKRAEKDNHVYVRESAYMQVAWRIVVWPIAIVVDLIRGRLAAWLWAPQREHEEHIRKLREESREWSRQFHDGSLPQDQREMVGKLADMCNEMADELGRS